MAYLLEQTADARQWPTDEEVMNELPKIKAYGNIKQSRLRAVLSAVELQARTERHESVTLPTKLDVEHIMPRAWRTHWGEDVVSNLELSVERDRLVNTLGNLTLVTQKLNGTLSNRPWRDADAAIVAPSGRDARKGKRSLLSRFSVLVLNKDIVDHHVEAWTDDDIRKRSDRLSRSIVSIWPRGG